MICFVLEEIPVSKLKLSAELAFSKGQSEESLKIWTQVISREPKNEQHYYKRFRVQLRLQRFKDALKDLTSAIELKPAFEIAISQRAGLHLRLGHCREGMADFQLLQQ